MTTSLRGQKLAAAAAAPAPAGGGGRRTGETVEQWRQKYAKGGMQMVIEEYNRIRAIPSIQISPAFQQNAQLNRYHNIQLIDPTRVLLTDGLQPEYIHANRVEGYNNRKNAYILTQAPLEQGTKEYWRMVWQERAQVLVCLTSMKEKGQVKANQFFPHGTEFPYRAGPIRVLLLGVHEFKPPRRVVVLHLRVYCWFAKLDRERDVSMVCYGEWPDRGVPADAGSFLDLLSAVETLRETATRNRRETEKLTMPANVPPPPVIVNCSAGVGRSATFVACQIELERLRETGTIDVDGTVRRLRQQRWGAVQNYLQHAFIYRILVEAAKRYGAEPAAAGSGAGNSGRSVRQPKA